MERAEKIGLGIAAGGHVALFGLLSLSLVASPEDAFKPKPIEVMITDEVGLESAAPNPSLIAPATSVAPELGLPDEIAPLESEPLPETPTVTPTPQPRVTPTPTREPAARPRPRPRPMPDRSERRRPDKPSSRAPRGSRLGDDFLKGVTDSPSLSRSQAPRAEKAGPAVVASLQQELYRRVKPRWTPPTGADAEKLRTKVTARLDRSGNVVGTPTATTSGITASNRPQVALHQERAIAAVRLAAPYTTFPDQYYDEWKVIEPVLYLGL